MSHSGTTPTGKLACDDAIAFALAQGRSFPDAAIHAGCSVRTIYRRWATSEFRRKVFRLRGVLYQEAVGHLARVADKAVGVLERQLDSKEEKGAREAAKAILDNIRAFAAPFDTQARLMEIEDSIPDLTDKDRARIDDDCTFATDMRGDWPDGDDDVEGGAL